MTTATTSPSTDASVCTRHRLYVAKHPHVEAIQWDGTEETWRELQPWQTAAVRLTRHVLERLVRVTVQTSTRVDHIGIGSYIVRDADGNVWGMPRDRFQASYTQVEP